MMRYIFVLFLSIAFYNYSFSQCENTLELVHVSKTNNSSEKGAIEVFVKANTTFEIQLIAFGTLKGTTLETHTGKGDKKFIFEGLSNKFRYRVYVRFDEVEFPCSNKVLDDIVLKED